MNLMVVKGKSLKLVVSKACQLQISYESVGFLIQGVTEDGPNYRNPSWGVSDGLPFRIPETCIGTTLINSQLVWRISTTTPLKGCGLGFRAFA